MLREIQNRPKVAVEGAAVQRCWRCGSAFDRAAWRLLTVVERVDPPEIQRLLLNWPSHFKIEVRRCSGCGSGLARKERS
jgi:hypothetical protein